MKRFYSEQFAKAIPIINILYKNSIAGAYVNISSQNIEPKNIKKI
jgi:hypothetical protein